MVLRQPLFPGDSEIKQIKLICNNIKVKSPQDMSNEHHLVTVRLMKATFRSAVLNGPKSEFGAARSRNSPLLRRARSVGGK